MNFMNVRLAMHLYDELAFYEEDGDLYSDEDIDIFNMSSDSHGVSVPCFEIAIHSVGMSFPMQLKPVDVACPHCQSEPIEVDGVEIDPCMGKLLPGVRNACCGHGNPNHAYIQWDELDEDQSGAHPMFPRYKSSRGLVALSLIYHLAGR